MSTSTLERNSVDIDFPSEAFWDLYEPLFNISNHKRYKIYYGGRGGSKSWQIARALIIRAHKEKLRILCTREIQRSIKESVKRLLENQIYELGLSEYFTIADKSIKSAKGSEFLFEGLYRNVDSIKSMEGINICWVEEGHMISAKSWKILTPTIREPNSEIWVSFNPDGEEDCIYEEFISKPRKDAVVVRVNYKDNPYFPDVLREEMEYDKKYNYQKYLNVWEGEPIRNYDSCIYRFNRDINIIDKELPYTRGIETCCSWDFGVADDTAIIFYQIAQVPKSDKYPKGIMVNIFDEYCNNNKDPEHYRAIVDAKEYQIDAHYCDPSGANRESDLRSWIDKLSINPLTKRIDWSFEYTHAFSRAEMIDNANYWMPFIRLNRTQTPKVYEMFRRWTYRTDNDGNVVNPPTPLHDRYSHFGTSFYYFTTNRFPIRENETVVEVY